jgi:hypothetical protein
MKPLQNSPTFDPRKVRGLTGVSLFDRSQRRAAALNGSPS